VLAPDVLSFVLGALPAEPARVLEVGAGSGELAAELRRRGYDVVAIDPAGDAPGVRPISLLDLDEAPASFDAAVAVVSLHHVEPLEESCRALGSLIRAGGSLVVDEIDRECFDERAAGWWLRHRTPEHGGPDHVHPTDPAGIVAFLRGHIHPVERVREALQHSFRLGEAVPGAHLHRWEMPPGLLEAEQELIAAGRLPAVGVRFTGVRV
jgi:SAM-dependent methyltransferase